ncbi:MAG: D-alanine--D-alanine ligase, partial [Christensenellaceae bacterium]|nr:D-alanine--D-alanine ligase [Christensenellaceae bacterium]
VSKASNKKELEEGLDIAFTFDRKVLVEKAINNPMELNCSVLGDERKAKASVIEMPVTGGNLLGFIEKYISGVIGSKGMASLKRVVPAPIEDSLTKELQELSLNVFKELDCKGVVRIDYMYDVESNNYYITEINVIPGSLSYYLWEKSDISYSELIDLLVDIALHAHSVKQNLNYTFSSDILKSGINGKKGTKGKL